MFKKKHTKSEPIENKEEEKPLKADMSVIFPKQEIKLENTLTPAGMQFGFSVDFNIDHVSLVRDTEQEDYGLTPAEKECERRFTNYVFGRYEDKSRSNFGELRSFSMYFNTSRYDRTFAEYREKVNEFKQRSIVATFNCGQLFFGYRVEVLVEESLLLPVFLKEPEVFRYSGAKLRFSSVHMYEENSKENYDGTPAQLTTFTGDIEAMTWL